MSIFSLFMAACLVLWRRDGRGRPGKVGRDTRRQSRQHGPARLRRTASRAGEGAGLVSANLQRALAVCVAVCERVTRATTTRTRFAARDLLPRQQPRYRVDPADHFGVFSPPECLARRTRGPTVDRQLETNKVLLLLSILLTPPCVLSSRMLGYENRARAGCSEPRAPQDHRRTRCRQRADFQQLAPFCPKTQPRSTYTYLLVLRSCFCG